jgi:hypothetical protein
VSSSSSSPSTRAVSVCSTSSKPGREEARRTEGPGPPYARGPVGGGTREEPRGMTGAASCRDCGRPLSDPASQHGPRPRRRRASAADQPITGFPELERQPRTNHKHDTRR